MKNNPAEEAENKLFDSVVDKEEYRGKLNAIKVFPGKKIADILSEIFKAFLLSHNLSYDCQLERVCDLQGNLINPDGTLWTENTPYTILSSLECVDMREARRYLIVPGGKLTRSKRNYGVPCLWRTFEICWNKLDVDELVENLRKVPEMAEVGDVVSENDSKINLKRLLRYVFAKYVNPQNNGPCGEQGYLLGEFVGGCEEEYEKFDEIVMQQEAKAKQKEEERKKDEEYQAKIMEVEVRKRKELLQKEREMERRLGRPLTQEEAIDLFIADVDVDAYGPTDDKAVSEEPKDLTADDDDKEN